MWLKILPMQLTAIALMTNYHEGAPTEFLLAYNPFLCSGKINRITVSSETGEYNYYIKAANGKVKSVYMGDENGSPMTFQYDSQGRLVHCSTVSDFVFEGENFEDSLSVEYGSSPNSVTVTKNIDDRPEGKIQRTWYGKNNSLTECSFTELFSDEPNDYYQQDSVNLNFTYGKNGPETLSESGSDYIVYVYGTTYFSYTSDGLLKEIAENSEEEIDVTITYTWTTVSA